MREAQLRMDEDGRVWFGCRLICTLASGDQVTITDCAYEIAVKRKPAPVQTRSIRLRKQKGRTPCAR